LLLLKTWKILEISKEMIGILGRNDSNVKKIKPMFTFIAA